MANQNQNGRLLVDGYYLTDGGLETTLIFHQGIELKSVVIYAFQRQLTNHFQ